MAKGFFSKLLTSVALMSGSMVMMVQAQDDGLHPLRTHSIYMPYIGKAKRRFVIMLSLFVAVEANLLNKLLTTQPKKNCIGSRK